MARKRNTPEAPAPADEAPELEAPEVETPGEPEAPAPEPEPVAAPAPSKKKGESKVYTPADFGYEDGEAISNLHHLNLIGKPKSE